MSGEDGLKALSYLWDGSQRGWSLVASHSRTTRVTFVFSERGPTPKETAALRQILPEFSDRPTSEVWARLRQRATYVCEAALFGLEAHRLLRRAAGLGLRTQAETTHFVSYMPIRDGHGLIIEDDDLAKRVAEMMIRAGVPVIPEAQD